METMVREKWSDGRLDEFEKRIDERFDRVDERFDEIDKRLDRLADGLESVQRVLIFGSITMSTAFVAGFVTLAIKI